MRKPSGAVKALVFGILIAPLCWVVGPSAAQADPGYPSAGQVEQAQQAARAKAAEVQQIQAQLAAGNARLERAQMAVGQAAEAFDAAQIELAQRTQDADLARANARRAAASYSAAQADAGRLASQAYRDGGNLAQLDALLSAAGPQDMLDRMALIHDLAGRQDRVLQQLDSSRLAAQLLQQRADTALRRQQRAAAQLAAARSKAEGAATSALAALHQTQSQQAALVTQLAQLQRVSVTLERQRQAALEAQRQARLAAARRAAEAAARRAAEEAARRARSGAGGSGSGGSGGSGGSDSSSGSSGGSRDSSGSSRGTASGGRTAVAWAKRQVGLPYQWGGAGPGSYDCSGLTMRAWQHAGVSLPHYAASQYQLSEKIPYSSMRPGDLIFYATDTDRPSSIHHVTMFIGGGLMVEAPMTGLNVRIVPIRWGGAMPWAGRP